MKVGLYESEDVNNAKIKIDQVSNDPKWNEGSLRSIIRREQKTVWIDILDNANLVVDQEFI